MNKETPKFQIEPVVPADEEAVCDFLARVIIRPGARERIPAGWLEWMASGAAAAGLPEIPAGWKLTAGGEIHGVHLVVPFRLAAMDGTEAVTVQSSGYYVDPRWHGPASGALFLSLARLRTRYHCSVNTANAAAAAVWQAFRGEKEPQGDVERCRMSFSMSLAEEALARRFPGLRRLLGRTLRSSPSLPASRLEALRARLGPFLRGSGMEAVPQAAQMPWSGAGAIPSESLLRWRLSRPRASCDLLILERDGLLCAVFLTAFARGHRAQLPAVELSCIWGPAWDAGPAATVSMILRAAKRVFPLVTLGFHPAPETVTRLFRERSLDANRRWMTASPQQPPLRPGWNGLNSF